MVKPFITFEVPDGEYWLGYGALLITPLILTWKEKAKFVCTLGIAAIWLISRYTDLTQSDFLGHIPFLYLNFALICIVLGQRWLGYLSIAIAAYCSALIIGHWSLEPSLTKVEILIYNLMFAISLIYIVLNKDGGVDEPEVESNTSTPMECEKAA